MNAKAVQAAEQIVVGESPAVRHLLKVAKMVAATDVNVLLLGECGTGKEVLARSLHRWSPRATGGFVSVHCRGLDQAPDVPEICERGEGYGTLFLDEVAELTARGQASLLRCLEDLEQRQTQGALLRVIAASAQDLGAYVEQGQFRRDLYHRLCVVPLELPPLRDRPSDIPLLVRYFLDAAALEHGLQPPQIRASAMRLLKHYDWPGNLRELRNLCERLVILLPASAVTPGNLPAEIRAAGAPGEHGLGFRLPPNGIDLSELEGEAIRQALDLAAGNKSRAARLLGLSRDAFLYRLRKRSPRPT
jgi:DNA-binding NtrC family response regulator